MTLTSAPLSSSQQKIRDQRFFWASLSILWGYSHPSSELATFPSEELQYWSLVSHVAVCLVLTLGDFEVFLTYLSQEQARHLKGRQEPGQVHTNIWKPGLLDPIMHLYSWSQVLDKRPWRTLTLIIPTSLCSASAISF